MISDFIKMQYLEDTRSHVDTTMRNGHNDTLSPVQDGITIVYTQCLGKFSIPIEESFVHERDVIIPDKSKEVLPKIRLVKDILVYTPPVISLLVSPHP